MSKLPARRQSALLTDFADVWSAFIPGLSPTFGTHLLRVEDTVEDDRYVVRAEIPGVDPAKDLEVSVHDGQLTIRAERSENRAEKGRSEFSYGSFVRTVALPAGATDEDVTADYTKGILTVRIPLAEAKQPVKRVEVKSGE
ncbi:Hsp20/alpha crystallin family protein [Nocardia sp. BMG111209]|uniref:Hsp20/alpha crystallin family protein n=1 Tax=Nocardia sp. BMG111209 TaxID=1160137 RepID=UPI000475F727|nr:Hsp20/alpha crystallin family protein [Nocardia sp. BMG111209]